MEVLELLKEAPLVGLGSAFKLYSHSNLNIHHSFLNNIVVYGYPIGLIMILLIYRLLLPLREYLSDTLIKNCVIGFWVFLLIGFSETNLIGNLIVSYLLLGIAYSRIKTTNSSNKN